MTDEQKRNADVIVNTFKDYGVTNKFTLAGVLAVVMKECGLKLNKGENLNYTKERLPEVWGVFSKTGKTVRKGQGKYNFNQLAVEHEKNPVKLGNFVYGVKPYGMRSKERAFGNTNPNDGWNYRGRGFHGLTFKGNYKQYGDLIGVDLVATPDKMNELETASKVLYYYMKKNADSYGLNLNNFTEDNAYNILYSFNAGLSPKLTGAQLQNSDPTGGYLRGKTYYKTFLGFEPEPKKKTNLVMILLAVGLIALTIYKRK